MILSCPSCRTRYIVPDSAIGVEGRKVRCATCRFSWFQDGADPASVAGDAKAVRPRPPAPQPPAPQAPAPQPAEPQPAAAPAVAQAEEAHDWRGTPEPEPEPDPYPEVEDPPYRPRRNPARLWTALAVVAALLMVSTLAAIYLIGPQRIAAWMSGDSAPTDEPLRFTSQKAAREPLPTDKELLTVTGEITNVSEEVQRVPQIRAELTDNEQQVIYSTTVAPPLSELQPGQRVTFSFSSTDVPKGGNSVRLAFGRTN